MCSSSISSAYISRFQTTSTRTYVGGALQLKSRVAISMLLAAKTGTLQHIHDGAVAFLDRSRNREQLNINTPPLRLSSFLHTTHFPRFTKSVSVHSHDFLSSLFPKDLSTSVMSQLRSGQRYIKTSYLVLFLSYLLMTRHFSNPEQYNDTFHVWVLVCQKQLGSHHVFERRAATQNSLRTDTWRLCCVHCAMRYQNCPTA